MPNDQWTDWALTAQFNALEKRLEFYDHALDGLSHFPIDVAKASLEIEHLSGELQTVRKEIGQVANTCEGFHREWQASLDGRQKGRTAIVVAVITGCCTVVAALVVLVGAALG